MARRTLSLAMLLALLATLVSAAQASRQDAALLYDAFPDAVNPDPMVRLMIDQVQSDTLNYIDRQLAGEVPILIDGNDYLIPTRETYSGTPIDKATRWYGEYLAGLGLDVQYQVWDDATNPNVIGELPGLVNPDQIFIIGGHLDDVSGTPGADDNASAVAATMVAADVLSQYRWGCTLRFAAWTGEEQWMLGSSAYARYVHGLGENIVGYLNLDMIAYNSIGSSPDIDLVYSEDMPESLELAQLFADVVDVYDIDLVPELTTSLIGGSDHSSFWDQGYNAIMVLEDQDDLNQGFHGPGDTPANNDLAYFTNLAKASIATLAHMSGCLIPNDVGFLDGHVTAQAGGAPLAGVTVAAGDRAGHSFPILTDGAGYYTRTLFPGTYTVTASAYGYLPVEVTGIEVMTDTVTTMDLSLPSAPTHVVSGTIAEAGTGAPLPAEVTFKESPVTVWSDPSTGFYEATLAEDGYTMQVRSYAHRSQDRAIVVDHDQTQDLNLEPTPCILLVDDDLDAPDVRAFYTAALDAVGAGYDVWDVVTGNPPALDDLINYPEVLWFSGYPYIGNFTGYNEMVVAAYLDAGGSFFLSSQDYLSIPGLTPFGQNYLHIANYTGDVDQSTVTGAGPYAGLGPYTLSFPPGFYNYSDAINPDGQAAVAFAGNRGNAGIAYDGASFKTVFLGFPFEALPQAGRTAVMQATLDFFGGCEAQVGTLAGTVTESGTGGPLPGATVLAGSDEATTDPSGNYTLTLNAGTYDVAASAPGYVAQVVTGVIVTSGETTVQDFQLELQLQPPGTLIGTVAESGTGEPLSGAVILAGSDEATTDPSGNYTLTLDAGTYDVTASAPGYAAQVVTGVIVTAGETTVQDFNLELTPPAIVVTGTLELSVTAGSTATLPLTITNVGGQLLEYALSADAAWPTFAPVTGTVLSGESVVVSATFNATSLEPGLYAATVSVASNDPENPVVQVPARQTVECEPTTGVTIGWLPAAPGMGEVATFAASADGTPPIEYTWDFGDGAMGSGITVTHSYTATGVYAVTVTASNCGGTEGVTATATITVVAPVYQVFLPIVFRR